MDAAPSPQIYPFFWPAALGIAAALIFTAVLTILFLRFGDKAIKVASMMLLSALISFGAGYFACAAYVLLSGNQTAWGQALRANGAVALGVPSAALAAFALVVVLPGSHKRTRRIHRLYRDGQRANGPNRLMGNLLYLHRWRNTAAPADDRNFAKGLINSPRDCNAGKEMTPGLPKKMRQVICELTRKTISQITPKNCHFANYLA